MMKMKCRRCNKEYSRTPAKAVYSKYCSNSCSAKSRPSPTAWNKGLIYGKARHLWKDQHTRYTYLHRKIARLFGKPMYCEICQITEVKRYEWANKSGEYKAERSDWLRLCCKCHRKYDHIGKPYDKEAVETARDESGGDGDTPDSVGE